MDADSTKYENEQTIGIGKHSPNRPQSIWLVIHKYDLTPWASPPGLYAHTLVMVIYFNLTELGKKTENAKSSGPQDVQTLRPLQLLKLRCPRPRLEATFVSTSIGAVGHLVKPSGLIIRCSLTET